jgi:hypothetical protein
MSVARFGQNILIDGGGGIGGSLYNTAVATRLQQLAASIAGRTALADIARRVRTVRIAPPSAPQVAASGEVAVYYRPSGADVDGKALLDALVRATPSAASNQRSGIPLHEIPVTKAIDSASVKIV